MLAECQRNPEIACIIHKHDRYVRDQLTHLIRDKIGLDLAEARTDMMMVQFSGLANRLLRNPDLDLTNMVVLMRQTMTSILSPALGQQAK